MVAVIFMSFMASQAMAWTCEGNGGYVGNQYGGGYTNTDPTGNTNNYQNGGYVGDQYGGGYSNTDPNGYSNNYQNGNSNVVMDANYKKFLKGTTSLREKLAAKQGEYIALLSQPNPNQQYAGRICGQMAKLNNQIWTKAMSCGLPAMGYYTDPNGYYNADMDANYQKFLTDTASLREQLAAKQGEYIALISQPNPDQQLAGQLSLQIAELMNQIREIALSYGIPARGGYCSYPYGLNGGYQGYCNHSYGSGGGGWGCW